MKGERVVVSKINSPKGAAVMLAVWFGLAVAQGLGLGLRQPRPLEDSQIKKSEIQKEEAVPVPSNVPLQPSEENLIPRRISSEEEVLIAVIDTGIDINHPDLKDYIWLNRGEVGIDSKGRRKETNGIDDDGNGYIDDVHGYDFVENKDATRDLNGHGTHIAGIIAKQLRSHHLNHVKIVPLTYYSNRISGTEALANSIKCVEYAIKNGVKMINYSGGGIWPNSVEESIFRETEKQGILVVAAAGNEASNSEKAPFFPANYGFSNLISVTAIDSETMKVLKSSNFGKQSVHVAAPGKDIYSTLPDGSYGFMTGTSQATAAVTGLAALAYSSLGPHSSPELIKELLMGSAEPSRFLAGKTSQSTVLLDESLVWLKSKGSEGRYTKTRRAVFKEKFVEAIGGA